MDPIERPPRGRLGDPGDDYPAALKNQPMDHVVDQWGERNRECTSFVAWALASRNRFNMPFHDNAVGWGPDARARGYRVDSHPAVGSVAWSNARPYGHVAYVEDVNGSQVHIEEYNHDGTGHYTSRTVPSAAFNGYIHFADTGGHGPTRPTDNYTTIATGGAQVALAGDRIAVLYRDGTVAAK